jgi:hypothetical protein
MWNDFFVQRLTDLSSEFVDPRCCHRRNSSDGVSEACQADASQSREGCERNLTVKFLVRGWPWVLFTLNYCEYSRKMSQSSAPRHILCRGAVTPSFSMHSRARAKQVLCFRLRFFSPTFNKPSLCVLSLSCGEARDSRSGLAATPSIRHLGPRTPRPSTHLLQISATSETHQPILASPSLPGASPLSCVRCLFGKPSNSSLKIQVICFFIDRGRDL